MARPSKSQVADSTDVSVGTVSGDNINQNDLMELIRGLQLKIEELEKKNSSQGETPIVGNYDDEENEYENITIRPDKYIKVMSLDTYPLNLSTEGRGKGRIFRFNEFGEIKRIQYRYLCDIIEHQRNFLKGGKFYILNRAVIHEQGLEEEYSKILTKENIEVILNGNDRDITISLFQSANKSQQEVIIQMLIDRRISGQNVDLNIWDKVNRLADFDMEEKYKVTKDYLDSVNKSE